MNQIRPSKKGLQRPGGGDLARMMTGEDILSDMKNRKQKDQESGAKKASKHAREQARAANSTIEGAAAHTRP